MSRYITLFMVGMLILFASGCGKDEPKVRLDQHEVEWLNKGDPAPFDGYLFPVGDAEWLLKEAMP